jgi:prepilin-type processing-associated H-X9-DG protein
MFTHNIYINPTTTYAWGQWWNLILKSPPYTKTIEKMLQCPSRDQSIVFNVFGNGYDYGINGYFSVYSPGSAPWARMQRIKHPSRKAQLMESQKGQRFTMAIATMEPQFRHLNSQSNVLFVDGHMSDWQKAELTMDNTKPPWDYVDGQTGK